MTIDSEVIDRLLADVKSPQGHADESGLLKQLTRPLLERMLEGAPTDPLGYDKHARTGHNSGTPVTARAGKP